MLKLALRILPFSWVQADAAAHEAKAEGLELPGPEGSNGTGPHSALHSHSLGGDAYSEDEFAEPYEDVRLYMPCPQHLSSRRTCDYFPLQGVVYYVTPICQQCHPHRARLFKLPYGMNVTGGRECASCH